MFDPGMHTRGISGLAGVFVTAADFVQDFTPSSRFDSGEGISFPLASDLLGVRMEFEFGGFCFSSHVRAPGVGPLGWKVILPQGSVEVDDAWRFGEANRF